NLVHAGGSAAMSYFVTGGTGFIGRNLIDQLIGRKGTIYVLVRRGSKTRFNDLVAERWADHKRRLVAVTGDLTRPALGVAKADVEKLSGRVRHFFHLAAIYDLAADAEANEEIGRASCRERVETAESGDTDSRSRGA